MPAQQQARNTEQAEQTHDKRRTATEQETANRQQQWYRDYTWRADAGLDKSANHNSKQRTPDKEDAGQSYIAALDKKKQRNANDAHAAANDHIPNVKNTQQGRYQHKPKHADDRAQQNIE